MAHTLRSILWSLAGIVVCGMAGGICGWWLVAALGLAGVPAALVGATAAWVALTVVLRKLGVVA